ncbi:putative phosphatidate phosphatase [Helianthus anomalus]
MYAVGRLGSYITQGVYTVSGPFHPFGGAVDIVVVQQEDGSLKSSPWYVRFGKFQGVLKAKERVVDINVNGVDADFSMYLDPRGEAYFLREVDSEEVVEGVSSHSSFCEVVNGKERDTLPIKSKSMDCDFDKCNSVGDGTDGAAFSRNNSKGSRILGFVLGRRSMKEHTLTKEEDDSNDGRMTQLERAEIAADLLESRWSTNHSSRSRESRNDNGDITGGRLETSMVLHEQHFANESENSGVDHVAPSMKVEETIAADDVNGVNKDDDEDCVSEERSRAQLDDGNEPEVGLITGQGSLEIVPESYAESASNQEDAAVELVPCGSVAVPLCQIAEDNLTTEVDETNEIRPPLEPNVEFQISEPFVEEQLIFGDLDDTKPNISKIEQEVKHAGSESTAVMHGPNLLRVRTYRERSKGELEGLKGNLRRCQSNLEIPKSREIPKAETGQQAKSLPNICRFNDPIPDNQDELEFYSPVGRLRSNWDLLREDASRFKKELIEKELRQSADDLSKDLQDGGHPDIVDGAGGSWSLWPFGRLASKNVPDDSKNVSDVGIGQEPDAEKEWPSPKSDKTHTRELTPTPEQLASLNLAEGQNTVTFTFSTSVLGSQKVDARIYLWSWDTRIVISDVDGTITKSDVLGQFMPLVGRDWSHIGVTHLFSAIVENGYQMLYLSARSISQASITRQFLFNLTQDGKALPDGPVVISPDGLFPSLFREVIRRAPHEFKIACLEDIKACFPPDRNPFYAGFGNRDTDEFSYLKVGIPKGKIFIINPKGEVVINRCIDSKSYASLHALVNGIFPPVSVHEEEDYNSWNFWKLPPPTVD